MPKPLFPQDVALLQESNHAQVATLLHPMSEPFAGGIMCRDEPGAGANCAIGFGLERGPEDGEIDRLIRFYEDAGTEPRALLCPFADPAWAHALGDAGFRPRHFLQVFARVLAPDEAVEAAVPTPSGFTIREVDVGDDEDMRRWAHLIASGFRPSGRDGEWPDQDQIRMRIEWTRKAQATAVVAELDGEPVAASGMHCKQRIAVFFGTTVLEPNRKRGIQQALIKWRCEEAARRGSKVATIGSRPHSPTERNAVRMGFCPAYTNVTLVRPGEGLKRVDE